MTYRSPILALLSLLLWCAPVGATGTPDYIGRLQEAVAAWQDDLPALKKSASAAAEKVMAEGHLYVSGAQEGFIWEAFGRSGGLMLCSLLDPTTVLTKNDVILAAANHQSDQGKTTALLERAKSGGAEVIIFSRTGFTPALPGALLDKEPSIESLSNVVGMWAWTGEFVRACLDHGKMPCMWESIWMPGGKARDTAFQATPFHAHTLSFPQGAPDLGRTYLTALATALGELKSKNAESFRQAKALLQSAVVTKQPIFLLSMAHLFPSEMTSNPPPPSVSVPAKDAVSPPGAVTIYLGYQEFPWANAALTGKDRGPCIITSSRHPGPEWMADKDHVYIDPRWVEEDAAVELPGYDVKILPISGVMQGAIFWELMETIQP